MCVTDSLDMSLEPSFKQRSAKIRETLKLQMWTRKEIWTKTSPQYAIFRCMEPPKQVLSSIKGRIQQRYHARKASLAYRMRGGVASFQVASKADHKIKTK